MPWVAGFVPSRITVLHQARILCWAIMIRSSSSIETDPDSLRDATQSEVKELRGENGRLKELVGEQALQIQLLKKSLNL